MPYYGFYVQDTFRALPKLTLEMGLREDFQVYPQPAENPAFPLTGQYPNQFRRVAPRFGFAWQPQSKTVVRGGFGHVLHQHERPELSQRRGLERAGIAAGGGKLQLHLRRCRTTGIDYRCSQYPPANYPLFGASTDISLVSPQFRVPYIVQASLQIEREISENTTLTIGTMWNHGVHLISGTAYDANLKPLQGTTTYIVCPPSATTLSVQWADLHPAELWIMVCSTEGRINPNLGQIQELISPAQNYYNSLFVQVQHRMSQGFSLQFGYTFAKSIMLDGMDFNNQFDFSNTHAPSLFDQRHRITFAAVYRPRLEKLTTSDTGRNSSRAGA